MWATRPLFWFRGGTPPTTPRHGGFAPPWTPVLPTPVGLGFARVLGPTRGGVTEVGYSSPIFSFWGRIPQTPWEGAQPPPPPVHGVRVGVMVSGGAGDGVGDSVGAGLDVGSGGKVGDSVGTGVGASVGIGVRVGNSVGIGVRVSVGLTVMVGVKVGVTVRVGVKVGVGRRIGVGVK